MSKLITAAALLAVLFCGAGVASASTHTGTKHLVLRLSDLRGKYKVVSSGYVKRSQTPEKERKHGLLSSYDRQFEAASGSRALQDVDSGANSFRDETGARWVMAHAAKALAQGCCLIGIVRVKVKRLDSQSVAFRLKGSVLGLLVAIREKSYIGTVLGVGKKTKFDRKSILRLAADEAKLLRNRT